MSGCTGCTRRTMLHGLGLALAGCRISLDQGPPDAAVDAEIPVPCDDGKFCLDLTRPSNAPLTTIGGSVKLSIPGDIVIVVRISDTELETVSAICTHLRCVIRYDLGLALLRCHCHGSLFSLDGSVRRGPAEAPLRVYANSFDPATNILSITL